MNTGSEPKVQERVGQVCEGIEVSQEVRRIYVLVCDATLGYAKNVVDN